MMRTTFLLLLLSFSSIVVAQENSSKPPEFNLNEVTVGDGETVLQGEKPSEQSILRLQVVFVPDGIEQQIRSSKELSEQERAVVLAFLTSAFRSNGSVSDKATKQSHVAINRTVASAVIDRLIALRLIRHCDEVPFSATESFAEVTLHRELYEGDADKTLWQARELEERGGTRGFQLRRQTESNPSDTNEEPTSAGVVVRITASETALLPWYFHFIEEDIRKASRERWHGEHFVLIDNANAESTPVESAPRVNLNEVTVGDGGTVLQAGKPSEQPIERQTVEIAKAIESVIEVRLKHISANETIDMLRQLGLITDKLLAVASPNGNAILFRITETEEGQPYPLEAATQLIKRIDEPATANDETPSVEGAPRGDEPADELQSAYDQAELQSAQIAMELRKLRATGQDTNVIAVHKQRLHESVQVAFDLRMKLQQAQLAEAEADLKLARERLARRQQIANKIIDRRIQELQNGEDTSWQGNERVSPSSARDTNDEKSPIVGELRGSGESLERWEIRFDSSDIDTYARQLDYFKIELGAVRIGGNVDYVSQLSGSRKYRSGPANQERRLYLISPGGNQKKFDDQLMRTAGIDINNRLVLQFFPKDVEDRLARIESEYANGKTDLESLNKTVFALRPKGSGWEFFVEEQQFRPAQDTVPGTVDTTPKASESDTSGPLKTIPIGLVLPRQFRMHWTGAIERTPTTADIDVPVSEPSHILVDEITGHHGLEVAVSIEPTSHAFANELLPRGQRIRIKMGEEELAVLKAGEPVIFPVEEARGKTLAVVKITARMRPATSVADIQELNGTWRLVGAELVSQRPHELPFGNLDQSSRIVIRGSDWEYLRDGNPVRKLEATYNLKASPQTVDLKYSVRDTEKHERRLFELHGDTLITARPVSGADDFPSSFDEPQVFIERYQRLGVVTVVSDSDKMVSISLGSSDGIRLQQRLRVSDGPSLLGTVEVTAVQENESYARIVQGTTERPIRKGDRVSPVEPRDRESVSATNNADDRVMQRTRTVPGTVHSASRSRENRWEIRYPSEPNRFAAAIDFLGVELGIADRGSQEITYLSGISAASPTVRRGPAVSETRLYLTMADADSIRIAKSLLEQAGIKTRDRVLLWFHSPWAERTLASLEAKAADAQSIDLVDKTVFGVQARGEEFEFYVISQAVKPPASQDNIEPTDAARRKIATTLKALSGEWVLIGYHWPQEIKEQKPEFEEIFSFSDQSFTIRRNGKETASGLVELNLDAESPRLTLKFRDENGFTGAHIDGPFEIRPNGELWLAVHDTSVRPSAEGVLAGQPRYIWRLKRAAAASRAPDDAGVEAAAERGAVANASINPKLAEICSQAHAAVASIKTLQYRFEQKDDEGWHAKAEFYADQEQFRVNREDVTGIMGLDAELKPKRSEPMKIAAAFDGQRQQYIRDIDGDESLRVKAGRAGASYGISTPQLWTYLWLRSGTREFHWDTILSADLWERRFEDAVYIGDVIEDGRRFEIVEFPQRTGRVACIYRVYFARDLGFLPLKYFRHTLTKNELSTTMEVTRFKTFTIDGKQIAVPLEVQHQETQADGVSKKGEGTMTVVEDSLKVNEPLDDSLFTLSRVDDAAEREKIP